MNRRGGRDECNRNNWTAKEAKISEYQRINY